MKRVLVVEDDMDIALALQTRLEHAGYQVEIAADALTGINQAWNAPPAAIILDIVMPAGGGFRVADNVRGMPLTSFVPVIFTTAYKDPGYRERAREFGAAGFLEKPYDFAELLALLERVTGRSSASGAPPRIPA